MYVFQYDEKVALEIFDFTYCCVLTQHTMRTSAVCSVEDRFFWLPATSKVTKQG